MHVQLEKGVLSHPVTALACSMLCGSEVLLVVRGADLEMHLLASRGTLPLKIFQLTAVMGLKVVQRRGPTDAAPLLFLFGDKSLCVLQVERSTDTSEDTFPLQIGRVLLLWEQQLDDFVLDCSMLCSGDRSYLAIGYAHNYVDVYEIDDYTKTPQPQEGTNPNKDLAGGRPPSRAGRFGPLETCVLFSLAFSSEYYDLGGGDSGWVTVASGTAFGKILLWRFEPLSRRCEPSRSLTLHEGVVFNIRFDRAPLGGGCSARIASVSDDRTVRVWDLLTGEQLFVGWGHGARVWDAVFLQDYCCESNSCGSGQRDLLATCSEDGSLRVWDLQTQRCLCCLRGHCCDIWRVARSPCGGYLFSGGNDGCAKAYCVSHGIALCPEESRFETIRFPRTTSSIAGGGGLSSGGHVSRRVDCVSFMRLSPCGSRAVVGLAQGCIWQLVLAPPSSSSDGHAWSLLTLAPAAVVSGDTLFSPEESATAVGLSDGRAMLLVSPIVGTAAVAPVMWQAHSLRTINIFLLPGHHVLTASTKGDCALWRRFSADDTSLPSLITRCCTAKGAIATSAALVQQRGCCWLLLGDCKGSVTCVLVKERLCTFCSVDDLSTSNSSDGKGLCYVRSAQHLNHPHGAEAVSVLRAMSARCFVSLGHDGSACIFIRARGKELFALANRLPLLPISSPDMLHICPPPPAHDGEEEEGEEGGLLSLQERSLFVGGYAGRHYVVFDVLRQLELLRVNGGSWKRPHSAGLGLALAAAAGAPRSTFLCAAPCEASGGTVLLRASCAPAPSPLPSVHFGYRSLGKVAYAVTLMHIGGELCAAVGGEEGCVKLLRIDSSQQPLSSISQQPLFEASMPGNVCIRSICACSGEGHTLLLAAGGRLTFALWAAYHSGAGGNAAAAVNSQLVSVGQGTTWTKATQDHRFLSAALLTADSSAYLVVLCDSRGVVTLASKTVGAAHSPPSELLVLEEFAANATASPVLCSAVTRLAGGAFVGYFGDTTGGVSVWQLRSGTRPSQLLLNISAHCLGCNCISIQVEEEGEGDCHFISASGGDDQSICIVGGSLHISEDGSVSAAVGVAQRVEGCSGSAVNGITMVGSQPELLLLSAGYDRRLAVWGLAEVQRRARRGGALLPSGTRGGSRSAVILEPEVVALRGEGPLLRYLTGCVTDLGDVGALDALPRPEGAHVVVAGEGIQMLSLVLKHETGGLDGD